MERARTPVPFSAGHLSRVSLNDPKNVMREAKAISRNLRKARFVPLSVGLHARQKLDCIVGSKADTRPFSRPTASGFKKASDPNSSS